MSSNDSVDREIEENQERKEAGDENQERGLLDLAEGVISPVTDTIAREDRDDDAGEQQRTGNDADQRA